MKVVNDLVGYSNLKVMQDPKWFSFSLDSVLLPRFVTIRKNTTNVLDIGTGNAPIPLILSTRTLAHIYGFEIQKDIYELAKETVQLNGLDSQISIINDDINNIGQYFKSGFFDVVVSNPPYFKINEKSKKNVDIHKMIARHEISLDLDTLVRISSLYLKIERVKELLTQKYNREPSIKEISSFLEIDENYIIEAINSINNIDSLDNKIVYDSKELYLYDVIPSKQKDFDTLIDLENSLNKLNKNDLKLIKYRYYKDLSQQQTAKLLGMSQVQVSRNEKKIIKQLKMSME